MEYKTENKPSVVKLLQAKTKPSFNPWGTANVKSGSFGSKAMTDESNSTFPGAMTDTEKKFKLLRSK